MRARATIVTMLVLGLVFGTSGVGLAVTGFTADDQASIAQYGTSPPGQGVKGERPGKGSPDLVLGAKDQSRNTPVQAARQVQGVAASSNLPFTGYAAIPVLLLGLALFGGGLVLHRSATRNDGVSHTE
jgi:hypothetical protein